MIKKWFIAMLGILFLPAYLVAAPANLNTSQSPALWLEKVAYAARTLRYQGVFLHQYGKSMTNYRLTHTREGANEYELREVLDGPVRKYYRFNNTVTVAWADGAVVNLDRRDALKLFPDQFNSSVKETLANYSASFAGKERIAGLDAQILVLSPKDDYRYQHRFWIDPTTGLLLKSVMLDKNNQTIEMFSFSSLKINLPIDVKTLIPPKPTKASAVAVQDKAVPKIDEKRIPDGFKLVRRLTRELNNGHVTTQYLYSDGLVAVSVFIEPAKASMKKGLFAHDGTYVYVTQSGPYQITALGDVPAATVETFARAFEFKQEKYAGS